MATVDNTTAATTATNGNDLEKGTNWRGTNVSHAGPTSGAPARGGHGVLNPDEDPTSWVPRLPGHRLGNPGPLGLMGFAGTTLVLSLFNVNAAGVAAPNVVVGMAIFFGGLAQLLAGMWEFACGNTFGATAFTGYGAFWLSYSAILIPGTGIISSYAGNEAELGNALGIYLFSWFIFTFLLLIAALRRNIGFVLLLTFLTVTFALLGASELSASTTLKHAGGAFGLITAFIAYYCAMAELLRPDDSWFTLPLGQIRRRVD